MLFIKQKFSLLIFLFVFILCLVQPLSATQRLINFQGHLTDQKGNSLDGTFNIIFSIYASDPNIGPLWTEEHNDVNVSNGTVNVLLGSITSFDEPVKVTFDEERYLGITIDCDHDSNTKETEMTPRQRILPAIYSYDADKLDGKDSNEYTTPQTDAGRPGVVENLYEGNVRLMDKYIKQADLGSKGCYISYTGPDCLPGFHNKGSLGEYGVCQLVHSSGETNFMAGLIFFPPGVTCSHQIDMGDGITKFPRQYVWGTAYLCCQ